MQKILFSYMTLLSSYASQWVSKMEAFYNLLCLLHSYFHHFAIWTQQSFLDLDSKDYAISLWVDVLSNENLNGSMTKLFKLLNL